MLHNTEDKKWWVITGREKEDVFIQQVCPNINLSAIINPEKVTNPYAPDLLVNGQLADLKCQETPFYKAEVLYHLPNQHAVTFNRKDYLRYAQKYPDIFIYFWIDWKVLSKTIGGKTFTVKPMSGVWVVDFTVIKNKVESRKAPFHSYQRRVGDKGGNATESYLLDLREFECLYLRENNNTKGIFDW
jgi:hypothetical protein